MPVVRTVDQRFHVVPSALMELAHALYLLGGDDLQQPWCERLIEERPDLLGSVQSLWPHSHQAVPRGWELLVMAVATHQEASTDLELFFERFPQLLNEAVEALEQVPAALQVGEEYIVVRRRLEQLREEPSLQTAYVGLLAEIWAELSVAWEYEALPVLRIEAARLAQKLKEGASLLDLLPVDQVLALQKEIEAGSDAGPLELVLTPLYFAGEGHRIHVGIPGTPYYLGYALRSEGVHRATERKAQQLARRVKALADPTRLTLLATIAGLEVTVGDLAKMLGITQPTVSGHLRILERAGLVKARKKGVKAFYHMDVDAVESLLNEASALLR